MGLKNKILLLVILFILTGCYSQAYNEDAEIKNKQHTEKIIEIINKKYPGYEIKELVLTYTDFSSSVRSAPSWIEAESAKVKIENEIESKTIQLSRELFDRWEIYSDIYIEKK